MGNCMDSSSSIQPPTQNTKAKLSLINFHVPIVAYCEDGKTSFLNGETTPRTAARRKKLNIKTKNDSLLSLDAPNARISEKSKTPKDIKLILNSIEKHFIFKGLSRDFNYSMIQEMKLYKLGRSETIFEQNQQCCNFFVIVSGKVEILVNGTCTNILSA